MATCQECGRAPLGDEDKRNWRGLEKKLELVQEALARCTVELEECKEKLSRSEAICQQQKENALAPFASPTPHRSSLSHAPPVPSSSAPLSPTKRIIDNLRRHNHSLVKQVASLTGALHMTRQESSRVRRQLLLTSASKQQKRPAASVRASTTRRSPTRVGLPPRTAAVSADRKEGRPSPSAVPRREDVNAVGAADEAKKKKEQKEARTGGNEVVVPVPRRRRSPPASADGISLAPGRKPSPGLKRPALRHPKLRARPASASQQLAASSTKALATLRRRQTRRMSTSSRQPESSLKPGGTFLLM